MKRAALFVRVSLHVVGLPPFDFPTAADVFGSGANEFSIRCVRIDQLGNPLDTTGLTDCLL